MLFVLGKNQLVNCTYDVHMFSERFLQANSKTGINKAPPVVFDNLSESGL
jgi:hypothetical protein